MEGNSKAAETLSDLKTAVKNGDENKVQELLKKLKIYDKKTSSTIIEPQTGFDLLRNALQEKRNGIAKLLLEYGISVNNTLKFFCNSPLHWAIKNNDPEMFRLLVSRGACKEIKNPQQKSPLDYAVELNNEEIVEILIENNVLLESKALTKLLCTITKNNNEKMFNLLTNYCKKVDCVYDYCNKSMLQIAVEQGYDDTVKNIVEKYNDEDINSDPNNKTMITTAVLLEGYFSRSSAKILLDAKFPIDPANATNSEFLHKALHKNFPLIVDKLLKYNIDPNMIDSEGNTLFSMACRHHHLDIAEKLLKNASVETKNQSGYNTILFNVIENFKLITDGSYRGWQQTKSSEELIDYYKRWLKILKILIKKGINVNEKNDKGQTPLHFLAQQSTKTNNSLELGLIARLLLLAKARINARDNLGNIPLEYAIQVECPSVVEVLLPFTKIEHKNSKGETLLHHTAKHETSKIAEMILLKQPNVNAVDVKGCTPLHLAAENGSRLLIECLLNHNADVNAKDHQQRTPLHYAVSKSRSRDVIGELVKHQADLNCVNKDGLTPLMIAATGYWYTKFKLVEFLLYSGSNPNIKNKLTGKTILHIIAEDKENNDDFIPMLLNYNADLNILCNNNKTALDYLTEDMAAHLKKHGMDFYERRWLDSDIFKFSREYRTKIHFLIEYIIKLKNIGHNISDENLKAIDRYWDVIGWAYDHEKTPKIVKKTNVDDFKKKCEKEAELLKNYPIGDNKISLYKLLNKSTHQLARIMNKSMSADLAPNKFVRKFPVYRDFINKRVEKALNRKKLLDSLTENYVSIFFPTLPYACVDEIMSYLRQQDIELLLEVIVSSNLYLLKASSSNEKVKSEKTLKQKSKKRKLC